jgi:hypothetical protein
MEDKLVQDLNRLSIDFEKSSPFAEWTFKEVTFPAANVDVTIRHKIEGKGELVVIPVSWRFPVAPSTPPTLYTMLGTTPQQVGYIKVRSTVAGFATVLIALRRDS